MSSTSTFFCIVYIRFLKKHKKNRKLKKKRAQEKRQKERKKTTPTSMSLFGGPSLISFGSDSSGGNPVSNVVSFVFIIVFGILVFMGIRYFLMLRVERSKNEPLLIDQPIDIRRIERPFSGELLRPSLQGNGQSYSFWIYVNDWTHNYGRPKLIFYRGTQGIQEYGAANPSVYLYPNENKLMVRVSTLTPESGTSFDPRLFPELPRDELGYTIVNPARVDPAKSWNSNFACDINGIPLQRWVHVVITQWGRNMDVFVNGKLKRSCVLPGVPLTNRAVLSELHVGGKQTFNGHISRLQYFNRVTPADEVYRLYTRGPHRTVNSWESLKDQFKLLFQVQV